MSSFHSVFNHCVIPKLQPPPPFPPSPSLSRAGVVIVVLIVLILVSVILGGVVWAYCHPNTTAGLWLIEHRPRRLKTKMMFWKNNGAEELEDMEGSPVRVGGGGVETYNCAVDTT